MASNNDCRYNPLPEEFAAISELHLLGCTYDSYTNILNSFGNSAHNILTDKTYFLDALPQVSALTDDEDIEFWKRGYYNGYKDDAAYSDGNAVAAEMRKPYEKYIDTKYILLAAQSDYTNYPGNQVFSAGMIRTKREQGSDLYMPCLVGGGGKSYYTLETRLSTLPNNACRYFVQAMGAQGVFQIGNNTESYDLGYGLAQNESLNPYSFYNMASLPRYSITNVIRDITQLKYTGDYDGDTYLIPGTSQWAEAPGFYSELSTSYLSAEQTYMHKDYIGWELNRPEYYAGIHGMSFFLAPEINTSEADIFDDNAAFCYGDDSLSIYSGAGIYRYGIASGWGWNQFTSGPYINPIRYTGSILSDPNMYASTLAYDSGGKYIVQVPEWRVNASGGYWKQLNTSFSTKQHRSKMCQIDRAPAYAGLDKISSPTGWSSISSQYPEHFPTSLNIPPLNSIEGYASTRDTILASINTTAGHSGLLNNLNDNIKDIEFELFYCVNVNDPTAALNLVEFNNKLLEIHQNIPNWNGFDTKIVNKNNTLASPNASNTVRGVPNIETAYNTTHLIYKSSVQFDEIEYETHRESYNYGPQYVPEIPGFSTTYQPTGAVNLHLEVIPSVIITAFMDWTGNKGPVYTETKTITGTVTGSANSQKVYTYGEYIIALFNNKIYLVSKSNYKKYMYNPVDFISLAQNICNGTDDIYSYATAYNANTNKYGYSNTYALNNLIYN